MTLFVHTLSDFSLQTNVLSAKYVMKTDDDAFVRVDEILSSLDRVNISHGLLYGRVNSDSQPHRDPYSKWYITPEVSCVKQYIFHIKRLCNFNYFGI